MRKMKRLGMLLSLVALAGCARVNLWGNSGQEHPRQKAVYEVMPPQADVIALQNLKNRIVIYCADSPYATAEMCAKNYERSGYVRLTNIPSQPADKDFLKADTYPTRRWRKDELVPRW